MAVEQLLVLVGVVYMYLMRRCGMSCGRKMISFFFLLLATATFFCGLIKGEWYICKQLDVGWCTIHHRWVMSPICTFAVWICSMRKINEKSMW